jgi:hypothetical protein
MINVSVFGIVMLIIILHTILAHLITWGFRITNKQTNFVGMFLLCLATAFEIILLVTTLNYYLN